MSFEGSQKTLVESQMEGRQEATNPRKHYLRPIPLPFPLESLIFVCSLIEILILIESISLQSGDPTTLSP